MHYLLYQHLKQLPLPEKLLRTRIGKESFAIATATPNVSSTNSIQESAPHPLGAGAFLWP